MSISPVSSPGSSSYSGSVSNGGFLIGSGVSPAFMEQAINALTPADRQFLHDTYGTNFTVASNGGRPVGLNMIGLEIATSRMNGSLPAGTSVSADYLKSVLTKYQSQRTNDQYGLIFQTELGLKQFQSGPGGGA